ncbi:MAG: hypothetical protein ACT4QG_04915 [Sporichthyaceae bacterium]
MEPSPDHEARISALESRMEEVAADAAAARHLAAAADRDLADLSAKVDANTRVISALGEQTRARFDAVDARFDAVDARIDRLEAKVDEGFAKVDEGFAEMRAKFDGVAAGFDHLGELLERIAPEAS